MHIIFVLLVTFASLSNGTPTRLQERFSWKAVDFAYPDEYSRQKALKNGDFIPEHGLIIGIEVWRNKLFVTVPRWFAGIPATLSYIDIDTAKHENPRLIPYPSWEANELGNCDNALTTVYRVEADKCGRLWVMDQGTYGIADTATHPCPYALSVYDLNTDKRLRRYVLRPEDTNVYSLLAALAVDIGTSCEDTFAYFSDELGFGLIVYSWEQNTSWRFEHNYFMPDPMQGYFNFEGLEILYGEAGIFGLALGPRETDGSKILYFTPVASLGEFSVSTKILRNQSRLYDSFHEFHALEQRINGSRSTARVITDDGILFLNLVDKDAVGCWNLRLPHKPENHAIVDSSWNDLSYPIDIKVDDNQNIWVVSDRMPYFEYDWMDFNEVNYRVFSAPVATLINGTVCDVKYKGSKTPSPMITMPMSKPSKQKKPQNERWWTRPKN